ncbi:MAG: ABC-F family ATP-binding cassette domain-containing protein [Cytophagaceae bacterium]
MNYLSAENISKSFNEKLLFKDITLGINRGQKVALVGANGSGKSTLFQILSGKLPADSGLVVQNKDISIGYLDQNPQFDPGSTVKDALFHSDSPVIAAIKKYQECLLKPEDEKSLNQAMEKMDSLNAWDYESRTKQIISSMGLKNLDQKTELLSGGEKKRLALARLLIDTPDLLILDEPTNHLDLDTIEWLENFLSTANTTLFIVTHDRYFLDKVCNEIIELENGQIYKYKGNYTYYLEKKAERELQEAASVDKAKNLLRTELEWMRRQPKARGTKSKSRIDAFYDLEEKAKSGKKDAEMQLQMEVSRQGNKIAEIDHISKSFGSRVIIDDFTYVFKKKDRIGIVGKNGSGKSTFLNMLTGRLKPDKGTIILGETTKIGYFSQEAIELKEEQRVIEAVKEVAEVIKKPNGETITASQFLEHFLFPPALQYTYIKKLSGGERKRLQLLKILIQNPNLLILDEPTNDLDINTLNVLQEFLKTYSGSLVIVSHDRFFLDQLTEHLFIFEGNGHIRDFFGNYTDFREIKEKEDVIEKPSTISQEKAKEKTVSDKKKLSFNEQKEFETLEKDIEKLETEKELILKELNSGDGGHEKLKELSEKFENLNKLIDEKTERWIELSERK